MARYTGTVSLNPTSYSYPILVGTKRPDFQFLLDKPKFTVGRIYTDYIINDDTVSRLHCSFILQDNKWTLHNFSSNGTYVNGWFLKLKGTRVLFDQDVIQFGPRGKYAFMFYADKKDYHGPLNEELQNGSHEKTDESVERIRKIVANTTKRKIKLLEGKVAKKNNRIKKLVKVVNTLRADNNKKQQELLKANDNLLKAQNDLPEESESELNNSETPPRGTRNYSNGQATLIKNIIEDELACTICKELLIEAVSINCGHSFCKHCLSKWKRNSENCPLCRELMTVDAPDVIVNSLLERIVPTLSDEQQAARRSLIKEREAQETRNPRLRIFLILDVTQRRNFLHGLPPRDATVIDLTEGDSQPLVEGVDMPSGSGAN